MRSDHELIKAKDLAEKDGHSIYTRDVEEGQIEYEILCGNEKIVFMKAGAGGSAQGRENVQFLMAQRIHRTTGATVILASNPGERYEDVDEETIRAVISCRGLSSFRLCFWGISDGAFQNLRLAKRFPETEKWIGVNPSFITVSDLEEKLTALPQVCKILICSSNDADSSRIFTALQGLGSKLLKLVRVEGADHNFNGMKETLLRSIDFVYGNAWGDGA